LLVGHNFSHTNPILSPYENNNNVASEYYSRLSCLVIKTRGVVAILDLWERFEAWIPTLAPPCTAKGRGSLSPVLGARGYYPRKNFEILSAKSCDLVHILCCNCQYNSTI